MTTKWLDLGPPERWYTDGWTFSLIILSLYVPHTLVATWQHTRWRDAGIPCFSRATGIKKGFPKIGDVLCPSYTATPLLKGASIASMFIKIRNRAANHPMSSRLC